MSSLLERHGYDRLDEDSARAVTAALARRGLRPHPSLYSALAKHGEENWTTDASEPWNAPGLTVEQDQLRDISVMVRTHVWLALQTILAFTVIALGIVSYRTRSYAVAISAGGLIGASLVVGLHPWMPALLPGRMPRGRLLGAIVAVIAISVALAALAIVQAF